MKRCSAISTGPLTHLDHLAPICDMMQMPLYVDNGDAYAAACKYYPHVQTILKEPLELDYLATYDALFGCGKFWAIDLKPLIQLLFQKNIRLIHCPHGNSDKGHTATSAAPQDMAFVYGQHMIDLLAKNQTHSRAQIRTGNLRLAYYKRHQGFYDSLVDNEIALSSNKKTILYAPTWGNEENPTSFFESLERVVQELHGTFNLIIKLHPFLEEHHPAATYRAIGKCENYPSVLFLHDFPPIYPLLHKCDIYLGDFSSIGYDYLAFDRPMYFFKPKENPPLPIHQCGYFVPSSNILEFIVSTLEANENLSAKRQALYQYAFGKEPDLDQIRLETLAKI